MTSLFVVATPIGNLEDISSRALRVLQEVSLVASEDTRVTRKLFHHFSIKTPLVSVHEFSKRGDIELVIKKLADGQSVALVTDAGTPAISDPGAFLVAEVRRLLPEVSVIPIPGASALTAALSVSGFRAEPFTFFGFPPVKKGRKSFFENLRRHEETLIFFEAPHRIIKTLEHLVLILGTDRSAFVAREITKLHETHYGGSLEKVTSAVKKDTIRGEYVVIIGSA